MFKEEVTQYCPMCQEWAEKYDQLKAENEHLSEKEEEARHYLEEAYKYKQALQEIKDLIKSDYCADIKSCEFCANISDCINRKILQKCEVVKD